MELKFKRVVDNLQYIRIKESSHTSAQELTKKNLFRFSFVSIIALLLLGVWQIFYLRSYFKSKHLI